MPVRWVPVKVNYVYVVPVVAVPSEIERIHTVIEWNLVVASFYVEASTVCPFDAEIDAGRFSLVNPYHGFLVHYNLAGNEFYYSVFLDFDPGFV